MNILYHFPTSDYCSGTDLIRLETGADKVTVIHEMIHWARHIERTGPLGSNRQLNGPALWEQYDREEVIANLGTLIILESMGIYEHSEGLWEDIEDDCEDWDFDFDTIVEDTRTSIHYLLNEVTR